MSNAGLKAFDETVQTTNMRPSEVTEAIGPASTASVPRTAAFRHGRAGLGWL